MDGSFSRLMTSVALIGVGFLLARIMPDRLEAQGPKEKVIAPAIVHLEDAVPTKGDWGQWKRYFRGDTYGTIDMVVLAVTLKPGQSPHPPHRHAEEEIMILAEGSGTWHLDGKESRAQKGDALYAAPWTMHGLKNTSDAPLTYYMVKWGNKGVKVPEKPKDEK